VAKSSLDLSDRPALAPLGRLIASVREAIGETPLLLVGATARDLFLVHVFGVDPLRATVDTDLALAVGSWSAYERLRAALIESGGFVPQSVAHRLVFGGQQLDIIPFGGVERSDRSIAWPPDGGEVMSAAGLSEALAAAVVVRLPGNVSVDVAPLAALALLKIWAWMDRRYTVPGKDAGDLWLFLRYYAQAGQEDRLYGEGRGALEQYDFDIEQAGAWLLGHDARAVVSRGPDPQGMLRSLERILTPETDPDGTLPLVKQMPPGDHDRQLSLLSAFCAGLFEVAPHARTT
jgi:predicted nucleotidyltransferase